MRTIVFVLCVCASGCNAKHVSTIQPPIGSATQTQPDPISGATQTQPDPTEPAPGYNAAYARCIADVSACKQWASIWKPANEKVCDACVDRCATASCDDACDRLPACKRLQSFASREACLQRVVYEPCQRCPYSYKEPQSKNCPFPTKEDKP